MKLYAMRIPELSRQIQGKVSRSREYSLISHVMNSKNGSGAAVFQR